MRLQPTKVELCSSTHSEGRQMDVVHRTVYLCRDCRFCKYLDGRYTIPSEMFTGVQSLFRGCRSYAVGFVTVEDKSILANVGWSVGCQCSGFSVM